VVQIVKSFLFLFFYFAN